MIHQTAIIDPGAEIYADVDIGPYSIIGKNVSIGSGTRIGAHVVITGKTSIGANNHIFHHVSLGEQPQDKNMRTSQRRLKLAMGMSLENFVRSIRALCRIKGRPLWVTEIGSWPMFILPMIVLSVMTLS